MRNAKGQSTMEAVIESDSEREETESANAELGQETLLPNGDLSGFASVTQPTQSLAPTFDRNNESGTGAASRRPLSSEQKVDATDCEQNRDPHDGKEGFLAQVTMRGSSRVSWYPC